MCVSACAFTGHRPSRFSFGYNEADERCLKLKALMRIQIVTLAGEDVTDFYTGMALGVDQWAAEIVLDIKKARPSVRLIAVRPCETQADSWSAEQRERMRCRQPLTHRPRQPSHERLRHPR